MARVETIGGATLYHGDARELIGTLSVADARRGFDHVISDPPYEAHMHAAKRSVNVKGSARRIRTDGHANPPPVDFDSVDGLREVITGPLVAACGGWLILFATPEGIAPWRDAIEVAGARYKRACFWVKPDSAPQFNGQGPAMAVEAFVTAWCGPGVSSWNGGGKRNWWLIPTNGASREGTHPTEKPLALMAGIVADFTRLGDMVLDPFMGSGTTGVACVQAGRRFVGIEQYARYFDIACRRIEAAVAQGVLFEPVDQVARQGCIFEGIG